MIIGAIFLSMSIAPTEEMILIAFKMSYWQIVRFSNRFFDDDARICLRR